MSCFQLPPKQFRISDLYVHQLNVTEIELGPTYTTRLYDPATSGGGKKPPAVAIKVIDKALVVQAAGTGAVSLLEREVGAALFLDWTKLPGTVRVIDVIETETHIGACSQHSSRVTHQY